MSTVKHSSDPDTENPDMRDPPAPAPCICDPDDVGMGHRTDCPVWQRLRRVTGATCPGCACDLTYRRQAERQALKLLERNPNTLSVAREFPGGAAELAQIGSEITKDFAATLRYAATIAENRVLRAEVRRLGGDPEELLGEQP